MSDISVESLYFLFQEFRESETNIGRRFLDGWVFLTNDVGLSSKIDLVLFESVIENLVRGVRPLLSKPIVVVRGEPNFEALIARWYSRVEELSKSKIPDDYWYFKISTIPEKRYLSKWQKKLINAIYDFQRSLRFRTRIPVEEIKFVEDEFIPSIFSRGLDPEYALKIANSQEVISRSGLTAIARICVAIDPFNRDLDEFLASVDTRTGRILKWKLERKRRRGVSFASYELTRDGELRRLESISPNTRRIFRARDLNKYFILRRERNQDLEIGSSMWNLELMSSLSYELKTTSPLPIREVRYRELEELARCMSEEIEKEIRLYDGEAYLIIWSGPASRIRWRVSKYVHTSWNNLRLNICRVDGKNGRNLNLEDMSEIYRNIFLYDYEESSFHRIPIQALVVGTIYRELSRRELMSSRRAEICRFEARFLEFVAFEEMNGFWYHTTSKSAGEYLVESEEI